MATSHRAPTAIMTARNQADPNAAIMRPARSAVTKYTPVFATRLDMTTKRGAQNKAMTPTYAK